MNHQKCFQGSLTTFILFNIDLIEGHLDVLNCGVKVPSL